MTTLDRAIVAASQYGLRRTQARAERRSRVRPAPGHVAKIVRAIIQSALYVAAAGAFVVAAWMFDVRLGWAVIGVAAIALERIVASQ